jgi:type VI secretion system secreted protein Hcp
MAGYIKIGDIKGEAVDSKHKEWINVLSVSQSLSRPMSAGISGSTRQRASVSCGDVLVVKEMDASTPKLIQAICDGKVYPKVEIDLVTSSGASKRVPFYQIELTNVMISSYSVSGATDGPAVPTEQLSLNYEEIKWTYDRMGKDGASQGKVDASWKVEEGVA